MAAQREKSAVAAAAHGAAVSGSPSPSSSSGGPAAASSGERWSAAIGNLGELGANVDALQKLLGRKAVFVDDDIFSKASLAADQARTIKVMYAVAAGSDHPVPYRCPPLFMLGVRFLGSPDARLLKGVDPVPFSLNVEFTAQKAKTDFECLNDSVLCDLCTFGIGL